MNERIAIIGTAGVPANYGGFETLADNLLNDKFHLFTVYCSRYSYREYRKVYKNANLVFLYLNANGIQSIPYDIFSIIHSIATGHRTLLILGTSGAISFPIIKLLFPYVKIITNIDGIEWKREKWNFAARKILHFFEKIAVRFSDKVICDNLEIKKYVKDSYQRNAEYIAYGGDHASTNKFSNTTADYYLSVCRIEPENNIHIILETFSKSNENILIIGNWNGSSYGKNLKEKYNNIKNITLMNPVYDQNELFRLRDQCSAYIHGHSAGGTNPSLVEIMHFAKPVIAYDCIFNRSTLENQGIYFSTPDSLTEIITHKGKWSMDTQKIQEIARKRYTWSIVCAQYAQLFDEFKAA